MHEHILFDSLGESPTTAPDHQREAGVRLNWQPNPHVLNRVFFGVTGCERWQRERVRTNGKSHRSGIIAAALPLSHAARAASTHSGSLRARKERLFTVKVKRRLQLNRKIARISISEETMAGVARVRLDDHRRGSNFPPRKFFAKRFIQINQPRHYGFLDRLQQERRARPNLGADPPMESIISGSEMSAPFFLRFWSLFHARCASSNTTTPSNAEAVCPSLARHVKTWTF